MSILFIEKFSDKVAKLFGVKNTSSKKSSSSLKAERVDVSDSRKLSIHLYAESADVLDRASDQIKSLFQERHHKEEIPNINSDFLEKRIVCFFLLFR